MIKLIVACTKDRVIGLNGKMPWNIKEELAYFRKQTLNQSILMGRTTFEHIGKVLPNRHTYVLTNSKDYEYNHENVTVINDVHELFKKFEKSDEILYIAGGAKIYEQFYKYAEELSISYISEDYEGDAYFVDIDFSKYEEIAKEVHEEFVVKRYKKI